MSLPGDPWIFLGLVYLSIYLTLAVLGLGEELRGEGNLRLPRLLVAASALSVPFAAFGVFAYLAEYRPDFVAAVWTYVFAFVLVVDVLELAFGYRALRANPDPSLSADEARTAAAFAMTASFLVELPCLWMNGRLAFG